MHLQRLLRACRKESALSGLEQTGRGAGWVRGLKGRCCGDVSLPRWLTPRPLPTGGNGLSSPPPGPPVTPHRLHIWGKTPSWRSLLGLPETFSACFGDAAGGGRGCRRRAAGKAFYGQDPEGCPCCQRRAAPSPLSAPGLRGEGEFKRVWPERDRGKGLGGFHP